MSDKQIEGIPELLKIFGLDLYSEDLDPDFDNLEAIGWIGS